MTDIDKIRDLYFKKLGWCGCGEPPEILQLVKDVLLAFQIENWKDRCDKVNELLGDDTDLGYVLLYSLDHVNLIEHGSNVWNSWLSDYGKEILNCLNRIENLESVFEQ